MLPVAVKRAAFRQLYSSAVAQANTTLQGALATAIMASLAATLSGKQVIEASAEGAGTKYQLPPGLGTQTSDVAVMWGQLQDLYDKSQVSTTAVPPGGGLAAETGNLPSAAGAAIYAWMMQQLTVVRSFQTDHSLPNIRI